MLYLKSVLMGIVEGLTEFLPISSTGHLIIFDRFLNFADEDFGRMYEVVIQLGAILAVVVYFHRKLIPAEALHDAVTRRRTFLIWLKSAVGVLPALVVGGLFGKRIQEALFNPLTVAVALAAGGVALILIESVRHKVKVETVEELGFGRALAIGAVQCLAMIPGVSRSAATILGGLLLGASRTAAVEYSFFLAIPTMCAASGYSLLKQGGSLSGTEWAALAVGFAVSFLVAWGVIAFLMGFIKKYSFKVFGWYRILLAAVLIILMSAHLLSWK